jgi:hypothetical protein
MCYWNRFDGTPNHKGEKQQTVLLTPNLQTDRPAVQKQMHLFSLRTQVQGNETRKEVGQQQQRPMISIEISKQPHPVLLMHLSQISTL